MGDYFRHLHSNDIRNCSIQWVLTPYNRSLNILESIETPTPKVGTHLGVWRFIPSHFPTFPHSCIPRNMKCDSWVSLLARTFTSPCLGHEPKARVATIFLTSISQKPCIMVNHTKFIQYPMATIIYLQCQACQHKVIV
jgi:hypothetical protein